MAVELTSPYGVRGRQAVSYTHGMNQHSDPQTVLITGANSGIGKAAATELARRGWHVYATARSPERGRAAVSQIQQDSGSIAVELLELDLASFASVRRAVNELLERTRRLDVAGQQRWPDPQRATAHRRRPRDDDADESPCPRPAHLVAAAEAARIG